MKTDFCYVGGKATKIKWDLIKKSAQEGKIDEIEPSVFIRYYRTLKQISTDYMKPLPDLDHQDIIGEWYYGPTGSGKSHTARLRYPNAYLKIANNKWWDGYQLQDFVLLDDLDKKHDYMGYHLKIWADIYAFTAEIKGGTILIRPKKIIVTSNYHPNEIWEDANTREPILRRFNITLFPLVPPPVQHSPPSDVLYNLFD